MIYCKKLPKWSERSLEVRYFFNPLIILNILLNLIRVYKQSHNQALPVLLPFYILPFFIYEDLYNSLPKGSKTVFTTWIQREKINNIYPEYYKALYPYIQEAVLLGFAQKLLYMNKNLIDSANEHKDKKLDTKLNICCIWFSPEKYRESLKGMGVKYEYSD